jgi:hypothetical protein
MNDEQKSNLKRRNLITLSIIVLFCGLLFTVSLLKMSAP